MDATNTHCRDRIVANVVAPTRAILKRYRHSTARITMNPKPRSMVAVTIGNRWFYPFNIHPRC
jgi:hypothetical protein